MTVKEWMKKNEKMLKDKDPDIYLCWEDLNFIKITTQLNIENEIQLDKVVERAQHIYVKSKIRKDNKKYDAYKLYVF